MDLVLYCAADDGWADCYLHEVQAAVPRESILVCSSLEELARALRRPSYGLLAVVLVIVDRCDLTRVLSLQRLLSDMRIIVILPDHRHDTIAHGHRLRPRFLTFADAERQEVTAVLTKMLHDRMRSTIEYQPT